MIKVTPANLLRLMVSIAGSVLLSLALSYSDKAIAGENYQPAAEDMASLPEPIDALVSLKNESAALLWWCDGRFSWQVNGSGIQIHCADGREGHPAWRDVRSIERFAGFGGGVDLTFGQSSYFRFVGRSRDTRNSIANAVWVLSRSRAPTEPQADSSFQAALAQTAGPVDSENLRRIQVQVEAMVRANRTVDAARMYRDTLRTTPAWAEGHFNLGLLYGELELYPEAITEMRRYLYLSPNALDARAVQDRIYEWEATVPAEAH